MSERGWVGLRVPAKLVRDDLAAAQLLITEWLHRPDLHNLS